MNIRLEKIQLTYLTLGDRTNISLMLNEYFLDPMGMGDTYPAHRLDALFDGLMRHPTAHLWLAFGDDETGGEGERYAIGMAVCFEGFSTFSAAPLLNIHDLIVRSDMRRKGVAKALFAEIEDFAKNVLQACRVTLEVRQDNPGAQALYRSLGYSAGDTPMEFWGKRI